MRPSDLFPKFFAEELIRCFQLNPNWVGIEFFPGEERYRAYLQVKTWLQTTCRTGADFFAMHASSYWLSQGPKIFSPNKEQCKALENIKVNLTLDDYSQPFPAIMVVVDYPPFTNVLCFRDPNRRILSFVLHTKDHLGDITTTVATQRQVPIEYSLQKFDDDCKRDAEAAAKALRVACNSCLALSHYGHHLDFLFPKEVANDQKLAKEKSERGERARKRLALPIFKVSFSQEVVLHQTKYVPREPGQPTNREVGTHWRRGHWAMQPCGVGWSERKRILRPPVLVRADLFQGDLSKTEATYR